MARTHPLLDEAAALDQSHFAPRRCTNGGARNPRVAGTQVLQSCVRRTVDPVRISTPPDVFASQEKALPDVTASTEALSHERREEWRRVVVGPREMTRPGIGFRAKTGTMARSITAAISTDVASAARSPTMEGRRHEEPHSPQPRPDAGALIADDDYGSVATTLTLDPTRAFGVKASSQLPGKRGRSASRQSSDPRSAIRAIIAARRAEIQTVSAGDCHIVERGPQRIRGRTFLTTRRRSSRRSRAMRSSPRSEACGSREMKRRCGQGCGGWRSDRGSRRISGHAAAI